MSAPYKLHYSEKIILQPLAGGLERQIPIDPTNGEYQQFLSWAAVPGNAPDPADPAPPPGPLDAADTNALTAFRLGWVLGQARLGRVAANGIQRQCDTIEAANISTVAIAATHIKTLAEAVEELAGQLQTLKRAVAIQAQVEDR